MRIRNLFGLAGAFLALALSTPAALADSTQGAAVPVFEPEFIIPWNGGTIHTDNKGAVPEAVDWNGDGSKDLLVGVFYNGNIWYYPNYGTNDAPLFKDRFELEADGVKIAMSYG